MDRRVHTYQRKAKRGSKRRVSGARLRDLPQVIHSLEALAQLLGVEYGTVHSWTQLHRAMPVVMTGVDKYKHYTIRRDDLIVWLYQTQRLTASAQEIALELVQALGARSLPAPEAESPTKRPSLPSRRKALPYSPKSR